MAQEAVAGNTNNPGIKNLDDIMFSIDEGRAAISTSNADVSSGIIFNDLGQAILDNLAHAGMLIQNGTVFIQGVIRNSSKGENVVKGEYSENPRSAKIFTYKETIVPESIPKDVAAQAAGVAGTNLSVGIDGTTTSVGMDGMSPLITDFGIGEIEPHIHTIVTQHVHRIEPTYLYRVPAAVGLITGIIDKLKQFHLA